MAVEAGRKDLRRRVFLKKLELVLGLVALTAILFLLNLFLVPSENVRQHYGTYPAGSTYSDEADGAQLLFRLLQTLDFDVQQSRFPLDRTLQETPDVRVVWHAGTGSIPVSDAEISELDAWVKAGGTLILTSAEPSESSGTLSRKTQGTPDRLVQHWLDRVGLKAVAKSVTGTPVPGGGPVTNRAMVDASAEEWPIGEIGTLHTIVRRRIGVFYVLRFELDRNQTNDPSVIKDSFGTVVARVKYGEGEVWLTADPYIFSNMLIQEADNALLAVAMVSSPGNGLPSSVVFDEYHLGFVQTRSLADAARTPLGKTLLYLAAVAAVGLATAGARFGRARSHLRPVGVSQRAFVGALAGLWQAAGATSAVADALWRRYQGRTSVRKRGLDERLNALRKEKCRVEELLDVARMLDQ